MPAQVTNYKCPACTGPLHFAGDSGKLECEYCGSSFEVAEIEAMMAQKEAEAAAAGAAADAQAAAASGEEGMDGEWNYSGENWEAGDASMKAYSCPSCGAELVCDETTAATSCPYCGNPTVVPGQFSGMLKPDYVIPFKLEKKDAVEALKKHYKGKKLLPKAFTDQNHIEEIKGIYVPFWLFDGEVAGNFTFEGTRSHTHREGDYNVTITEHYNVYRSGSLAFEKIPADGSSKMPDEHMDSIEPFDYSEMKPFSTAYLPGFLADKYDVSAEECASRAAERSANTIEEMLRDDASRGYQTCTTLSKDIHLQQGRISYALMPVWLLSTKWNNQNFLFAMNGQTGKLIGDLPVSWGKFWGFFFGISIPLLILMIILCFVIL